MSRRALALHSRGDNLSVIQLSVDAPTPTSHWQVTAAALPRQVSLRFKYYSADSEVCQWTMRAAKRKINARANRTRCPTEPHYELEEWYSKIFS